MDQLWPPVDARLTLITGTSSSLILAGVEAAPGTKTWNHSLHSSEVAPFLNTLFSGYSLLWRFVLPPQHIGEMYEASVTMRGQ